MHFLFLLMFVPAIAVADPIAMTATTQGSSLDLTFKNMSKKPIKMTTHVRAGLDHYDWLTVKLTGKTTRTMHFIETRTKAIPMESTIAPGKSVTRSIDLALWALHGENGDEPLVPDTYEIEATWLNDQEKLKLTATTKLVLAAPVETSCKEAKPVKTGIELLARQVGKTATIEVGIHNVDKVKHCVAARIATHEDQSDWLTLHFTDAKKVDHKIVFNGARDKSARITVELAPGATVWSKWNVAQWAKRSPKVKMPFPPGSVWAMAVYDASSETDVWNGVVKTSFGLSLP